MEEIFNESFDDNLDLVMLKLNTLSCKEDIIDPSNYNKLLSMKLDVDNLLKLNNYDPIAYIPIDNYNNMLKNKLLFDPYSYETELHSSVLYIKHLLDKILTCENTIKKRLEISFIIYDMLIFIIHLDINDTNSETDDFTHLGSD